MLKPHDWEHTPIAHCTAAQIATARNAVNEPGPTNDMVEEAMKAECSAFY